MNDIVRTDDGGLQVDEDGTGHVLSSASLAEEGVEGVVATSDGLVTGHLAIRLDSVLQAVQLPAGVSDLDSGLSDVYGDTFTLENKSCSAQTTEFLLTIGTRVQIEQKARFIYTTEIMTIL